MIPKEGHLRVIWRSFVTGRNRNLEKLRPIVLESWNRCRKLGVDPYQRFVTEVLPEKQLKDLQEENFSLLRVARPMMRTLFEFVAGSGFVVAVADKQGFLLEVIGNFEVLEAIQRGNFRPGARWNGISAGTNAIGTALNLDQSCQIFSYEHYCVCSHRWTCSAAPIHDPAGGLIGILDMTGSREKVHPHMLGMVVAGADAVERQLLTEKSARERDSANHIRSAIMESITDGILTVDHRQKIIHMNQAAGNILSLAPEQAEGKSVFEVLWSKERAFVEIVDGKRLVCDQELEMSTPRTSIRLIVSSQRIRGDGDNTS